MKEFYMAQCVSDFLNACSSFENHKNLKLTSSSKALPRRYSLGYLQCLIYEDNIFTPK